MKHLETLKLNKLVRGWYKKTVFLFLCCAFTSEGIPKELESSNEGDEIITIPIYSRNSNFNNNLSAIAADIVFIPLDFDPPFDDSKISDIALSENNIFLSTLSSITSYDMNGKFIRQIGSRGQGPREYIQITAPLQLDHTKKLIYVQDISKRVLVYRFDGAYERTFQLKGMDGKIALIDSTLFALRQTDGDRKKNPSPFIQFVNTNGSEVKTYWSNNYPIPKGQVGVLADMNPLWNYLNNFYYLEFGADTIFRISRDSIMPSRVLTGNLKLNLVESNSAKTGSKLRILPKMFFPNSGIFESDRFIVFRLWDDYECFFINYDKKEKQLHRTYYKDASEYRTIKIKIMDYFYDDVVSGLNFNPMFQSMGKAMALIPATEIFEKKREILDFIEKHPSVRSEQLKKIVQNVTDDDNSVLMVVTLK